MIKSGKFITFSCPQKTVMHPDMHHGFSYLQIINIWHISPPALISYP